MNHGPWSIDYSYEYFYPHWMWGSYINKVIVKEFSHKLSQHKWLHVQSFRHYKNASHRSGILNMAWLAFQSKDKVIWLALVFYSSSFQILLVWFFDDDLHWHKIQLTCIYSRIPEYSVKTHRSLFDCLNNEEFSWAYLQMIHFLSQSRQIFPISLQFVIVFFDGTVY